MHKSPCVGNCKINAKNDLCIGCSRSIKEISNWLFLNKAEKKKIFLKIKQRKELNKNKKKLSPIKLSKFSYI